MNEWKRVDISEVCELIVDCVNKTAPKVEFQTEFKMLRTTNVRHGRVDTSECNFVSEEVFQKWTRRAEVKRGDVLLTREAPIGEVGMIKSDEKLFLGQRLMQYRADPVKLDEHFLLYSFLSRDLQHQFGMHEGTGSVVSHIRVGDCFKFKINVPPLSEQKAIAHILGKLDDKIALNRQMNQTLEAMAQALFKSWFVDFDPVLDNALESGHEIPEALQAMADKRQLVLDSKKLLHTNPALAAQFPSAFVFNEVLDKWVPEGWGVKKLQEVVNVKYGKDHKKLGEGEIPCFGSGGVMRYVDEALFEFESVLIPRKGTLNNVMYLNKPFWSVDTMFYTEMNQEKFVKYFFYVMNRLNFSEMNEGSAVPSMTTAQLNSMDILLPSLETLTIFDSMVSKYFFKKDGNETQSESLTQLRDRLLPELISGRVRVSEGMIIH
jgi:type I restriction enzyme S subunit